MYKPLYDIFCRLILPHPRLRLLLTRFLVPDESYISSLFGALLCIHKQKEIGYFRAVNAVQQVVVLRDEIGPLINLCSLIRPGDTFLDIGANVGLYSSVLLRLINVFPDLRFYAFEANPDTAQRLSQTLESAPVKIFPFAVSDQNGVLEFCEGTTSGVFSPIDHGAEFTIDVRRSVVCHPLDDVEIEGDSLLLKIDVEGHEARVLDGASKLFQANRIKAIFVDGYSDSSIPSRLELQGFKLYDGHSLEPVPGTAAKRSLLAVNLKWIEAQNNL